MTRSARQIATLVAVAALAAACGTADPTVEVDAGLAGAVPAAAPAGPAPTAGPTLADPEADAQADPGTGTAAVRTGVSLDVAVGAISLLDGDEARLLVELPAAGESSFVSAELRPGSTAAAGALVAVTQAEGMLDLRWLTWDGADVSVLTVVEGAFPAGLVPGEPAATGTWTPDGESVAWLATGADGGVVLVTRGWADGIGTDDTATDNATFGLDGLTWPAAVTGWVADGDGAFVATLEDGAGTWQLEVTRQADGALAVPSAGAVRAG
jgi:hypothetical protein